MYRRPKFLEELIRIRQEMAREADYDTDLFSELVRSGRNSNGRRPRASGPGSPPATRKDELKKSK